MCSNSETTSNSTKLRPLRWAELMPELLAFQTDSPDSSFSSHDESSDASLCDATAVPVTCDIDNKENKVECDKKTNETKCNNVLREVDVCQKTPSARILTPTVKVGLSSKRCVSSAKRRGTPAKNRNLRESARCIFPDTPSNGVGSPFTKHRANTPNSHKKPSVIPTLSRNPLRIQNRQSHIDSTQPPSILEGTTPQIESIKKQNRVQRDLNPQIEQANTHRNTLNTNPIRYEESTPRNNGVESLTIRSQRPSQINQNFRYEQFTPQVDQSHSKRDALRRQLYDYNSKVEPCSLQLIQPHGNVTNQPNHRFPDVSTPRVKEVPNTNTQNHNYVNNYQHFGVETTPQVNQSQFRRDNAQRHELNDANLIFDSSGRKLDSHPNLRSETYAKTEPSSGQNEHVNTRLESGRTEPSGMKTEPSGTKLQALGPPETPILDRAKSLLPAQPTPSQPAAPPNTHRSFKTLTIKGKNYLKIRKLGVGGSCEVFKVLDVNTSAEFAVKCVSLAVDKELRDGYINEIRLLRELQGSDRVITMHDYEYCRSPLTLRVILEVGETDLASLLRSHGASTCNLPLPLVLFYWTEMLTAVQHIHQHGVVHADLKPANFLLVCGRLKLIDFGIASRIPTDATSAVRSSAAGTFNYISPEALAGGAGGRASESGGDGPIKITFRSDVWSLGCILYSMVYGKTPFAHLTTTYSKITAILDPNHTIKYPPAPDQQMPFVLMQALRWCLTYDSKKRPNVSDLLALPYVGAPQAPPELVQRLRAALPRKDWIELKGTFGIIEPDDL